MQSIAAWLEYIETLHTRRIDLGLERVRVVASALGVMKFAIPVITVAGTNGKGSCVKLLESIYLAAGFKVGAYTSPHLIHFNERIRLNNRNIDDTLLMQSFAAVENARLDHPLSFFEFITMAALHCFKQQALDVLLLEVGLGGRLDAVNVVESDLAIIASIDLEHQKWLGNTREQIAFEKAGVMRTGKPVVCGELNSPAAIATQADKLGARLYQINHDFSYYEGDNDWDWQSQTTQYKHLPKSELLCQNAATSLMALECLQSKLPVTEPAISQGLRQSNLAGRFEKLNTTIPCYVDVAHNPACARILAAQLARQPFSGQTIAIVGMLADKDIKATCEALLDQVDQWYAVGLDCERGAAADTIMQALHSLEVKNCYNLKSVESALAQAIEQTEPLRVLVFGSFYTVAIAKKIMEGLISEYQN